MKQSPPTFLLFVSRDELFSAQYKKYLADQMRAAFGYEGCPLILVPKPRPKTIEPVREFKGGRGSGGLIGTRCRPERRHLAGRGGACECFSAGRSGWGTAIPPGRMPGSTAGRMPAATE